MNRRIFLSSTAAALLLPTLSTRTATVHAGVSRHAIKAMQTQWGEFLTGDATIATTLDPIELSADEWRERVGKAAYRILFRAGTERSHSSPLNDEKRDGVFVCAACDLPLFSSAMKYDSRTGWPSFFTHIPEHVATKRDFKLIWPRTEYHCVKCGGHQGHLFDDGPAPTGERWCNNAAAVLIGPMPGSRCHNTLG